MSWRDRRFFLIGVAGGALFITGLWLGWASLQLATKAIPVLVLALWLRPWTTRETQLIAGALLLSALGDLCLNISPALFVAGLGFFLAAHVGYLIAFIARTRVLASGYALPVVVFGVATFLWLRPSLGALLWPVLAYVLVICTMLWRAWAQVSDLRVPRPTAWTAALGASSFAVSDVLVAYNRFIEPVLALQVLLMLLYWSGQWGIARSAARPAI